MKPALRTWLCIVALPLVVGTAYLLDRWPLAHAPPAVHYSGVDAWAQSACAYAWAQNLSRFAISLVLMSLSWLVLARSSVSHLVSSIYLLSGLLLTFFQPLLMYAFATPSPWLISVLGSVGLLVDPLITFLLARGDLSHFTFAFLATIGVASFLRPYVISSARSA